MIYYFAISIKFAANMFQGRMFLINAVFNQNISGWDVSKGTSFVSMLLHRIEMPFCDTMRLLIIVVIFFAIQYVSVFNVPFGHCF